MLLILGLVSGLYLICFLWFCSLCRHAIRVAREDTSAHAPGSNLIPFERGLELHYKRRVG
jgi:hypothetical protein